MGVGRFPSNFHHLMSVRNDNEWCYLAILLLLRFVVWPPPLVLTLTEPDVTQNICRIWRSIKYISSHFWGLISIACIVYGLKTVVNGKYPDLTQNLFFYRILQFPCDRENQMSWAKCEAISKLFFSEVRRSFPKISRYFLSQTSVLPKSANSNLSH